MSCKIEFQCHRSFYYPCRLFPWCALPIPLLFRFRVSFLSFSGFFVQGLGLGVGPGVGVVGALALPLSGRCAPRVRVRTRSMRKPKESKTNPPRPDFPPAYRVSPQPAAKKAVLRLKYVEGHGWKCLWTDLGVCCSCLVFVFWLYNCLWGAVFYVLPIVLAGNELDCSSNPLTLPSGRIRRGYQIWQACDHWLHGYLVWPLPDDWPCFWEGK